VSFATLDNSAAAPSDYEAVNTTVTFAPGQVSQQVTVGVNGDTQPEPDERFFVLLSNPINATLGDGFAVGRIVNDDVPAVTMNDATITEGHSGTREVVFTITLMNPPPGPVEVALATAQSTATAGLDYYSMARLLTFLPGGPTTQQVKVRIIGERLVEPDEVFFVNLLNVTGATIADGQGIATIINDDAQATVSISDAIVLEGNRRFVEAVFTVRLSAPTQLPIQVVVRTVDGTALAGRDYRATNVVLTFQPGGPLTQQVRVRVFSNRRAESDRTFHVRLSDVSNALLGDSEGLGLIVDDD
jgi:hypothetical protein